MDELVRAIADAADPADARTLARYFQVRPGGYGEGDVFVGVKLSALRGLAAPYLREPFVPDRWLAAAPQSGARAPADHPGRDERAGAAQRAGRGGTPPNSRWSIAAIWSTPRT